MPSLSLSLFLRLKICALLDIYIGDISKIFYACYKWEFVITKFTTPTELNTPESECKQINKNVESNLLTKIQPETVGNELGR